MISIIVMAVILLDQITKYGVQINEKLQNIVVIPGFFHITYARNTGMAWSLFSGYQAVFCLAAAAAIGGMLWYLIEKKPDRLTAAALSLMIGGAAGNLFDRLVFGYVRDFLDFYIFGYDFPIFNIADSALCIGVGLLLIASLKEENDGKADMAG